MSYLILLVSVLGLDIISKHIVQQNMLLYQSIPIIPGCFNLTYIENPGAAFGLLSDLPLFWRSLFFISVSMIALCLIVVLFFKCSPDERLNRMALTLIMAGALGNLIDRIRLGVVVDFIDVYWRNSHWPAFNIADSAISVGVGVLIIDMLLNKKAAAN